MKASILNNNSEYFINLPYPDDCHTFKEAVKKIHNIADFDENSIELISDGSGFETAVYNYYEVFKDYSIDDLNAGLSYYYRYIYNNNALREVFVKAFIECGGCNLLSLATDILDCNLEDLFIIKEAISLAIMEDNCLNFAISVCAEEGYTIYPSRKAAIEGILSKNNYKDEEYLYFNKEEVNYILKDKDINNINDYRKVFDNMLNVCDSNNCNRTLLATNADNVVFFCYKLFQILDDYDYELEK
jgi:hypothetical protein